MKKSELIKNINKALTGELTFNQWIENSYINWVRETDENIRNLSNYANYLGIDLDILLSWLTEDTSPPTNPEIKNKLWDKYGFIYCFVVNEPPPASVFPEGSTPDQIGTAFEGLKFLLASDKFEIGPTTSSNDLKKLFSCKICENL